MRQAVIVSPARTPVGAFGKSMRDVPVEELGAAVVNAVLERTGFDPGLVEDVIFAQSYANSETPCVGRWIALQAGMPETVAGMQLDRRCGGGLQAVIQGVMTVESGAADAVIVGGVESMSRVEHYATDVRWGRRAGSVTLHDRLDRGRERSQPEWRFGHISGMIETAENVAKLYGITREESDAYAATSQQRAARAWDEGRFDAEIVPITVTDGRGNTTVVARDEGIRPDTTIEGLARLRPIMPDGTVTAGNAAQQNDAAAAALVVEADFAAELGLEPVARLDGWAAVGCAPSTMGLGPVHAVAKLFERTGLTFDDLDLVELNEAFACQVLGVLEGWGWRDLDRLNVNGSGISLGHPVGATGVRIMTTMLSELQRRGGHRALETMCIGGGQGLAAVFERI